MSKADELLERWLTNRPENMDVCIAKDTRAYLNRKDKLVVGSEWVCDVDECVGGFITHYKDEVCNITKVFDDAVYIQHSINYEEDEIPLGQFLACFRPVEKGIKDDNDNSKN